MPYIKSDKTEARKDEKRKLLLKTASKVFAERGYHQTSVKDITDRALISVGTFYLYFKNKEDLFEKLYDEMDNILNHIKNVALKKQTDNPAVRYANVVASSIWAYQRYRELAKIMLIEAVGLNPRFEEKYAAIMKKSCEDMESILKLLKDMGAVDIPDIRTAAIANEGVFNYSILYWLRTKDQTELKVYAYPMVIYTLQALRMDYDVAAVKQCISDMFKDLDNETYRKEMNI